MRDEVVVAVSVALADLETEAERVARDDGAAARLSCGTALMTLLSVGAKVVTLELEANAVSEREDEKEIDLVDEGDGFAVGVEWGEGEGGDDSTLSLDAAGLADTLFDAMSDNDGLDDELELRERAAEVVRAPDFVSSAADFVLVGTAMEGMDEGDEGGRNVDDSVL